MICERLGIDGRTLATNLPGGGCCPPSICDIDPCAFVCEFLNLLPSGPLWDEAKEKAVLAVKTGFCDEDTCVPTHCHTIVDHAVYSARKLWSFLRMFLQPVVQESSPFTAVDAMDFWLEALGWSDCTACEGEPTISSILSQCPPELASAVRRGLVIALARLQLQPIATVDSINFVIQELGVELTPEFSVDPWASLANGVELTAGDLQPEDEIDCACVAIDCEDQGQGENCVIRPRLNYSLRPHSRTLRKVAPLPCPHSAAQCPDGRQVTPCTTCECEFVEAYFDPCGPGAGEPCERGGRAGNNPPTLRLWPGAIAALCIVKAMVPDQANTNISMKFC